MNNAPTEIPHSANPIEEGPTLTQVIALFNDLLAQTQTLETALYDCVEPLNLKSSLRTLAEASSALRCAKSELEQVGQIVEQRLSISSTFGSDRMTDGKHEIVAGEFLSPKQIVTLFKIGQERPDYPQILLADHLSTVAGTRPAAMVKAQHQAQKERQLHREALEETAKKLLEDVESRTCPTCTAEPSQFCHTTSGKIAEKPHRPRVKLSVLASGNPEAAARMTRMEDANVQYRMNRYAR